MDIEQGRPPVGHHDEMQEVLKNLIKLTGLSEQDFLILRQAMAQTQPWADEIVTGFYDLLFSHEPTARVFKDGERSDREISLRRWYLEVTSGNDSDEFWRQQWQVGRLHVSRRVQNPFMLGMMSQVQQFFLKKCGQEFEPAQAERIYSAFKRVTDVVQGLIVEGYHAAHLKLEKLADDLQQVILPLGVALSTEKDFDRLLERILLDAESICNADAGTLYERTQDNMLRFAIMHNNSLNMAFGGTSGKEVPFPPMPLYDEATGEPNDRRIATHVAVHGRSVDIPNIYKSEDFDFSALKGLDQAYNYRTLSCLTVPLKNNANEVTGVLQLFNPKDRVTGQVIPFDTYHRLVVESLASQAAVAINNQKLLQQQQDLLKFERDIHIGRQIQLDFLPKPNQLPQPSGWEIATYFQAAREVAGDFFDAFPIQNKVGLVIADVCDKGVGAALFMSLIRSLIRAFAEQHRPLGWLSDLTGEQSTSALNITSKHRRKLLSAGTSALLAVELTNNYVAHNHGEMNMFATLFFGVLDPATGVLTYINGGHPGPAIINSAGEVKARLTSTGPAVGMMPDMEFDIEQTRLEPGDILFTFSDGVTDARSPNKKFFTEKSLLPLLAQPVASASALLARVETNLRAHIATADQFDDITMLAVRRMPTS
jgi:sigma-B regulation protein RsbU (phosphoserine phosphatase)